MEKQFSDLRERLLRAGVAPRHVRRYVAELEDHLADLRAEEEGAGLGREEAGAAAWTRLGGTEELAGAMVGQHHFQSWSARMPWAVFGLGPLLLLGAAYVVALSILWSGWRIFLPGTDTPFVRIEGWREILYFNAGRLLYFGSPLLIGWGMGWMAVRQRVSLLWPGVGMVLIALAGGMVGIEAGRTAVPGGVGHISMSFVSMAQGSSGRLLHALMVLLFGVLPYGVWRVRRVVSQP